MEEFKGRKKKMLIFATIVCSNARSCVTTPIIEIMQESISAFSRNFSTIDSLDSDKDGYSNIVEINNLNFSDKVCYNG